MFKKLSVLSTAVFSVLALGCVQAQSLKIALAAEPTAADPHYHQSTPNGSLSGHLFETLVSPDSNMRMQAKLASSWTTTDDLTWVFNLRTDVNFSNGQPFTAKDVVFTLCRVMNNETGLAGSYTEVTSLIDSVTIKDEHTLIIKTKTPSPLLLNELGELPIIWSGLVKADHLRYDLNQHCGVTSPWPVVSDFNSGKAVIGTGPFTLASYTKGGTIELVRNEHYWGNKPEWKQVSFITVTSAAPRITGLLSGDYDLIENPAARDVQRLKNQGFGYVMAPALRVFYLQLDVGRSSSPLVVSPKGLQDNPLQDVRVRRALSMAIDREAIVKRMLDGAGQVANQFLSDGMFGTLAQPTPLVYDPEQAKKLLAQAGYPNGFDLTISGPNDRPYEVQVLQAIAQYYSRIGVKAKVDAMTRSVFYPRRSKREFSVALGGWTSTTGEASNFLRYWVATTNESLGLGGSNYGGFSDPEFDRVFNQALITLDDHQREQLLQQSVKITMDQLPILPLYYDGATWAMRQGLSYQGPANQRTLAMFVKSKP